jgi:5'-3' exonuclease
MILVDYSAISIGAVVLNRMGTEENLLRHLILNNLRSYNKKYREKYGEMVLCMDHSSWRKQVFPYYKASRKKSRDESKMDWDDIFQTLNKISNEIKFHMPYRVLHVEGAEGDDCIATMVERTQEFGKHELIMIIAADKDYIQLQRYPNVKQWSTNTKKTVTGNPNQWLHEAIIKGQAKDGIPNIKSPADFYMTEGGRQKAITAKFIDSALSINNLTKEEQERYIENSKLIDFRNIPNDLQQRINEEYENYSLPPVSGVLNYFIRSRCANLVQNLEDFSPGKV